jgi:RND family efflux transporter MFP subunit
VVLTEGQQQLGGVRLGKVERHSGGRILRTTGRVAADENRTFRINASTEMWIRRVHSPATGSLVEKDEALCGFYTTNYLTAAQSYLYILDSSDRMRAAGQHSEAQSASNDVQARQALELLQNLGVSDTQIQEIARTRKAPPLVDVRSPVTGYILSRKVSLGQWLGPGTEMYEIADLSRVWVYADLYESESRAFTPGKRVRLRTPSQNAEFTGVVSNTPPAFDAAARQFRVRLEVESPGRALWPGMFVNVELPVDSPEGLAVPASAVIYSGARKTVYVAKDQGLFEPREVETGWSSGDLVEVRKGLDEGERVVVSGNFLIDSEARMKGASKPAAAAKDPVCGMNVDTAQAGALKLQVDGATHYFCSESCKSSFAKGRRNPAS